MKLGCRLHDICMVEYQVQYYFILYAEDYAEFCFVVQTDQDVSFSFS